MQVHIIGGGLAGCEAAFQLAERGISVLLSEQKPLARTEAQHSNSLCELVCSNSFRGSALVNAVGTLKEELRRLGSLVMHVADRCKVPAGGALAVDRDLFSTSITKVIDDHPRIARRAEIVRSIPEATAENPVVIATGPLTGNELAQDLARVVGTQHLAYYDAIAPIVSADSIEWSEVFMQSRWGRDHVSDQGKHRDAGSLGDSAYVNCPFSKEQYMAFVNLIREAKKVDIRSFEDARYFEGCLPIEVMAQRGDLTLAFGPMKPIGLTDPRTQKRPFAVLQLRPENHEKTAYNMVGFQTRMIFSEQLRVFRMVSGLRDVEFLRYGSVHRNTFLDAPQVLDRDMQLRASKNVYVVGQLTGVEGYVESCASGFLCGLMLAAKLLKRPWQDPPPVTTLGGVMTHLSRAPLSKLTYQPSNMTWACLPPPEDQKLKKRERYEALSVRALNSIVGWKNSYLKTVLPGPDFSFDRDSCAP